MSGRVGLPCEGCAYRQDIPGDTHSRCTFDWFTHDRPGAVALIESVDLSPRVAKWFRWPFNYDPIWGPSECPQRADTADPAKRAKANPLADLLSLLR